VGRSILRLLPVFVASLYACGMGLFWASARLSMPGQPAARGDPGAYITAGLPNLPSGEKVAHPMMFALSALFLASSFPLVRSQH
jgi:hypothetical protein